MKVVKLYYLIQSRRALAGVYAWLTFLLAKELFFCLMGWLRAASFC